MLASFLETDATMNALWNPTTPHTKEEPAMMSIIHGMSHVIRGGVAAAFVISLVACGGAPKWVAQGSSAMSTKDEKSFYGVGSVIGIKNEPLAWDAAENR